MALWIVSRRAGDAGEQRRDLGWEGRQAVAKPSTPVGPVDPSGNVLRLFLEPEVFEADGHEIGITLEKELEPADEAFSRDLRGVAGEADVSIEGGDRRRPRARESARFFAIQKPHLDPVVEVPAEAEAGEGRSVVGIEARDRVRRSGVERFLGISREPELEHVDLPPAMPIEGAIHGLRHDAQVLPDELRSMAVRLETRDGVELFRRVANVDPVALLEP
jgi:hypothetical protein